MNSLLVFVTFLVLAIVVFALVKKYNTTIVLFLVSIITLAIYWSFNPLTGDSVITGNALFDALETVASQLYAYMKIVGMTLMPILGYSVYATHIKASPMMVKMVAAPLKKLKNPYMIGMFLGFVISGFLRMAVPSASPIAALLLGSLYPVMVNLGIPKVSAAAIILMGVSFDWSPADASSVLAVTLSTGEVFGTLPVTVSEYFTNYQLPFVFPIAIVITGIVMMFTNRYFDTKQGLLNGNAHEIIKEEEVDFTGIPKIYVIFPLLPLIFLLIFTRLGISLSYGPFAAAFISFIVTLIAEIIRLKSFAKAFEDGVKFVTGMGSGIGTVLYAGGSGAFAKTLGTLGGIVILYDLIAGVGLGGWPLFLIVIMFTAMLGFSTGGVSTSLTMFSPLMPSIATAANCSLWTVLMPFQVLTGHGRAISPLGPPAIMISGSTGVSVLELNKRCIIPTISSVIITLIAAAIFI